MRKEVIENNLKNNNKARRDKGEEEEVESRMCVQLIWEKKRKEKVKKTRKYELMEEKE